MFLLTYKLLKMPSVKIDDTLKAELIDSARENDELSPLEIAEPLDMKACGSASANDETASFTAESKRNVSR